MNCPNIVSINASMHRIFLKARFCKAEISSGVMGRTRLIRAH
ncbi:hypothetical protein NIES2104_33350 [Leptolyngbya sp. NIES-2104]|nr:hypothetical protein NIES2104_33350 [Leptolyngbya sp. NIES-2104]